MRGQAWQCKGRAPETTSTEPEGSTVAKLQANHSSQVLLMADDCESLTAHLYVLTGQPSRRMPRASGTDTELLEG